MNEIIFGAAYYPEYMPYERTRKDLEMMAKAGINTIRIAESTWSTLEPEEGRFDFSYIDRTLEAAAEYGLKVIIGTPTYAIPAWLAKKDPEIMVETRRGKMHYGARQIFDITNPTLLSAAEKVIRELAGHTASHPSVIGFQIDNETKHYGVVSERAQKLFVEYLKETFHTVEELNKSFCLPYWSNSIASWEDFPDIRGCINAGLACEYEKFQRKLAADYLIWQSSLVREYKREDQFITHNFDFEWRKFGADIAQDGYSYGVQPQMDHLQASGAVTLLGTDIYHPTQDDATGAEVAFGGDSIRSLKQEPYLIIETQAQAFKQWTPYPGQLRLDAYSHLASGAMGMMYWNWHSIHNSFETYWKGILSHDLQENPVYAEISEIGAELRKIGADHLCIRKQNRTALVVDHHTLSALNWHPTDRNLSYNDVVRWVYDSLYEMNIECDVVNVNGLDPSRYDFIVIPELYSVTQKTVDALRGFVQRGGVLFATFRSFFCDEHLSVWPEKQPYGMNDVFGVSYSQFSLPGKTTLEGKPVQYFMELLNPEGAEVLFRYEHKYWGRYAAAVRNDFGNGSAYYFGCYTDKELLKKVLVQAAEDADILVGNQPFWAEWPLVVRKGTNFLGRTVWYLMNFTPEEMTVDIPLKLCRSLTDGIEMKKGDCLVLKDWGIAVLEEQFPFS